MTTTHLAMKTIYTIKKLNSIYYGDKAQKRIFALSKTLKSIAQFHSLSSDLNDLHHAQITSIIQKSLHFDAFLCQTLKRLNTLLHPTTVLPRKSLKRFNKYNTKKQLRQIEKSLQKFIASYSSIQFKNKNTFFITHPTIRTLIRHKQSPKSSVLQYGASTRFYHIPPRYAKLRKQP